MSFCPNCGAQVTGAFCPNCGANVAAAGAAASAGAAGPSPGAASYATTPPIATAASGGLSDNVASCLCYAPFLVGLVCSIVFLVAAPYNRNRLVRFNAFQSLFLHAALFVLGILLDIVIFSLGMLTHGLGFLFGALFPLLWLAVLILIIYLMVKAYQNVKVKLPFIGDLADKQA